MSAAELTPDYLFNSDPTMHVIGDRLWLFTTHDQTSERYITDNEFWVNMYDYQAMSTDDLITWVHHGSLFSILDIPWAKGTALWDGDAGIEANGKYYAYVPAAMAAGVEEDGSVEHEAGHVPFEFAIAVLEADHPAGPYREAIGGPLVTLATPGVTATMIVSPSVVMDDGVPYLVFGWKGLNIVRLKPSMTELDGDPVTVQVPDDYVESPIISIIDGRYVLTFSCGGLWGEGYPPPQLRYAVSDSIVGPYGESRLLQDIQVNPDGAGYEKRYASSAHQGLAEYRGQWYLGYHRDSRDKFHRHSCVTPIRFDDRGEMIPIDPNTDRGAYDGSPRILLDAFAPNRREAVEFHDRHRVEPERGIRQAYHCGMADGGWMRYESMLFDQGAARIRIAYSTPAPSAAEAVLEVRLGAPDGELLGAVDIAPTAHPTDYRVVEAEVAAVPGIHDLYLVAAGAVESEPVVNLAWFTFTR